MSSPISSASSAQSQSSAGSRPGVTPLNGVSSASLQPFGDLLANQQVLLQQLLAAGSSGELPAVLGELVSDGELDLDALAEELDAADLMGMTLPQDGKLLPGAGEQTTDDVSAIGGVAAALLGWRQMLSGEATSGTGAADEIENAGARPVAASALTGNAELTDTGPSVDESTPGLLNTPRSQPAATEATRGGEFAAAVSGDGAADGGDRFANDIADISRLTTSRSAADTRGSSLQLSISQHAVDDPAWSEAVGARIHWMAGNGVQNATLKLNPEELGGIHVQLNMQGDRATVQFHTQHQDTGELIEKMLPRLNHAMEQQGMRLDDVKVSHQPAWGDTAQQQQAQQQSQQSSGRSGSGFAQLHSSAEPTMDGEGSTAPAPRRDNDGVVDAYA